MESTTLLGEQDKIFENIPCHIMEYSWYIQFPHGKFQVTWQNN
jgi:hypothetical protein